MTASDLTNLSGLMDDAKCFTFVRQRRCPGCDSGAVIRDGCDDTQPCRQRYRCKACAGRLDDLTGLDAASRHLPPRDRCAMVLAGHHQPLRVWVLCLYFMGLDTSDTQAMTEQLRAGWAATALAVDLQGEVEIDEVYGVAGHKGQPAGVAKRGGCGGAAGWQARRAEWPKVPMAKPWERQRRAGHAGEEQATHPWPDPARGRGGAAHAGQCASRHDQAGHHRRRRPGQPCPHGPGCPPRPPAGLGLRAQHGLPRARRIRPRRGISQNKLPLYLGFFQFVHNARRRGKALFDALIDDLVA